MFCCGFISNILIFIVTILILIITYFKWTFQLWKNKNVPYLKPSVPFGNMNNPFTSPVSLLVILDDLYKKMKAKGETFAGVYIFASSQLVPISPEMVKDVMTKDFNHFVDRGIYFNEKADPISAHLFSIEGDKWRNLRAKLTPTFTSGKIKQMLQTLIDCGKPMQDELDKLCKSGKEFDVKELLCCYTTDVIGSVAFGLECNSFTTTDSKFRKSCNAIMKPKLLDVFKVNFCMIMPNIARKLNFKFTDKEAAKFFMDVVKGTVDYRLKNNVVRKDFMQLLMDIKDDQGEGLTIDQMTAQAFVFFLGGFETSSTTMNYCLYELAQNDEVQDKLRHEINDVLSKYDGQITYESINDMKYLSQVIDETLRMYPPVPILNRIATKDWKITNTDIVIEEGTRVVIPVYSLHHDEEYFPDPEKFNPDRFSEANKLKVVPYSYLPFGDGPRGCIGTRFGLIQSKVGLVTALQNYKLTLSSKTVIPLDFDPFSFTLAPKNVVYLNVTKLN